MFRKKCKNCKNSISKNFEFCPYCGHPIKNQNNNENWGMLGKNDIAGTGTGMGFPFESGIFNKMLNNAMKMLEKEMQNANNQNENLSKRNFQLYINGKKINLNSNETPIKNTNKKTKIKSIKLPKNILKNFAKLPKHSPETSIRRLSDKIIYEIKMPGVSSLNNISITKLENSIEIKAIGKNKAYYKVIKIELPIIYYNLERGKLILELPAK